MTKSPNPDRLTPYAIEQISAEGLRGIEVISPSGEALGVVEDVVMRDANIDAVIVERGGFLGVGTQRVGVKTSTLDLLIDPYDKVYLRLPVSRDDFHQLSGDAS